MLTVNILGTRYTIKEHSVEDDKYLEECDGYCDSTSKTICISKVKPTWDADNVSEYRKKIMRHEIIHAYMNESGLQECFEHKRWGHDEIAVDWFAIQFPKILATYKELGCI